MRGDGEGGGGSVVVSRGRCFLVSLVTELKEVSTLISEISFRTFPSSKRDLPVQTIRLQLSSKRS